MNGRDIKTAVITGPTGVVGPALCETLLAAGCTVYAVCRPGSVRVAALPEHERMHRLDCDLTEMGRLPGLVPGGADAFFHLAWAFTSGPRKADMLYQIPNIQMAIEAIRAAAKMGCKVFVGGGSQAEYGCVNAPLRPDTPAFPVTAYGMAKLCAGQMCRLEAKNLGIDCVWPRMLSVYGPNDSKTIMITTVAHKLLLGEEPALTKGEQIWDFLYASDAGEALYRISRYGRDGMVYPVGSGLARPLKEYVVEMRDAIDPSLPLGFGQIPYKENEVMFLQADTTALREDTGFEPKVPFEEGIRQAIQWVKKEYAL